VKVSRVNLNFMLLRSLLMAIPFMMTYISHSKRNRKSPAPELDSCRDTLALGILAGICAIICDPKHLAKRVRYRLVCSEFWIGFGTEHIHFSLERIQAARFLPPVVFNHSRITKMHDVLRLPLFSPVTFPIILTREWKLELVLSP
jgi:hypothetical protein